MFGAIQLTTTFLTTDQDRNEQMKMFDGLGPSARAALNDVPRWPVIRTFIAAFRSDFNARFNAGRFGNRKLDFTDPEIDAEFAAFIDKVVVDDRGADIEWHRLKPRKLTRDGWRSRPIKLSVAPRHRSSHTRATRKLTRPSR